MPMRWTMSCALQSVAGSEGSSGAGQLGGIVPVAPAGRVSMLTDYIDAGERYVTCPNKDTVYGAGFQHVDTQPVVVQVPDFVGRFFVYQIAEPEGEMKRAIALMTACAVLLIAGCKMEPAPAPVSTPAPAPTAATTPAPTPARTTIAPADEGLTSIEAPRCDGCVMVTPQNFTRAETDLYFGRIEKNGGLGKIVSVRTPAPIDSQTVVRMNRDTLYSSGVFDLNAGPVTVTLPDAGKRFMSMQVIDEDEYTPMVVYGKGTYMLTKGKVGTRYVAAVIRTLVNPQSPQDLDEVHRLQDAIKVSQKSPGSFEVPKWDKASQDKVREALISLGSTIHEFSRGFGTKQQTDPVMHLVGAAAGWGGNPDRDAKYVNLTVPNNDGTQAYKVTVGKVPVDGFWSISVYNAKGYFQKNAQGAYSLNDVTAKKNNDGTVTVQFGGCDGSAPNCLPIPHGWNAMLRLYRPRPEVLSGRWTFPELQAM